MFKVHIFKYIENILNVIHVAFDDLEEAIRYGKRKNCHKFKIYDHEGHLHHDSDDFKDHDHYR